MAGSVFSRATIALTPSLSTIRQVVDLHHDGGPVRIQGQAGFGAALGGLERVRMRHPVRKIPVRDRAEVPPFGSALFQPFPGLFLQLQPEPFRDALLDPPDQNGRRADPGDVGRLIGSKQRDPLVGQLPFQLQGIVSVPGGPFDVFDHHGGEPGGRGFRFVQQVGQSPVTGETLGSELAVTAVAALLDVQAARFHVPVVSGHVEAFGQPFAGGGDLPVQRRVRVLERQRGGAGQDRYRDGLGRAGPV